MTPDPSIPAAAPAAPTPVRVFLVVVRALAAATLVASVLFAAAGRIDMPWAWGYIAALWLGTLAAGLGLDPELARERLRPAPGGVDRAMPAVARLLMVVIWLVAGLDARLHLTDAVPAWLRAAGLAAFAVGFGLVVWSAIVNRWFSTVVRIQSERGHRLVTRGPYRFVRHPGYAGMLLAMPASGLALGSWAALVPGVGLAVLVLRRLLLEDAYLTRSLEGYPRYREQVRARLMPGLW